MKSSSKFGIQAGEEAIHLRQEPAAGSTTSTPPWPVGTDLLSESMEDALDMPHWGTWAWDTARSAQEVQRLVCTRKKHLL